MRKKASLGSKVVIEVTEVMLFTNFRYLHVKHLRVHEHVLIHLKNDCIDHLNNQEYEIYVNVTDQDQNTDQIQTSFGNHK